MRLPDRIILIGMPGCGKSTLGKQLAGDLSMPFIDLDALIVKDAGMSIPQIFNEHGEPQFREIERKVLNKALLESCGVISTGGGAPCYFDNINRMKGAGKVIYLQASVDQLVERLQAEIDGRPKFDSSKNLSEQLNKLLTERSLYYEQAHVTVPCTIEVAELILRLRI